jgi:uncharacterized protein YwqG
VADQSSLIAKISPWLDQHRRTAFLPQVTKGQGEPAGTRFNGSPYLIGGEAWPACPTCKKPMPLFLQLNLSGLPAPYTDRFGAGLLQLFYCTTCEDAGEAWAPFDETSKLVRVAPLDKPGAIAAPLKTSLAADPLQVTGWTPVTDTPNYEEFDTLEGVETSNGDGVARLAIAGTGVDVTLPFPEIDELHDTLLDQSQADKLGGWPFWVQGVEYPACPQCQATMNLVFQITSEGNVPFMFGDVGIGHITQCPTHKDVVAFGWACS